MAVRRETVRLELEDAGYSSGIARAAVVTATLNKTIRDLDDSSVGAHDSLPKVSKDVDQLGTSSRRAGAEVDRLSGRMRIFADIAAILGPSLVPIGGIAIPAITGLAAQLGFAAVGMGSLVAAAQGVGDALGAVNDAALEPTAANLEKAREAMDQLGPAAKGFVARFQELRPTLAMIRDASAQGWFPGLTESLDSLEDVAPRVATMFERIGETGGNLIAEGAAALAGPEWADFLRFVETNAPQALDDLGRTVGNLTKGLANMWMAFDPLNDDFSTWLLKQSRAFREWSAGLSQTEGFNDFVDYIRENGPKVADAMGALGTALVEIVEAVAPLGGPSLQIIESFSKVVGAIADSDLGTPILAAVSALALLNRTLQVTAALQTRLTGSTALGAGLASGGILGAGRAGAGGLRTAAADLRLVGENWRYLGASAALAEARQSKALVGMSKGAAVVGGLAVASTGAADGLGLSTAALGAMMGTIGGPWGMAIGGGIGAAVDFGKALASASSAGDDLNTVLASIRPDATIESLRAASAALSAHYNDMSKLEGTMLLVGDWLGLNDATEDAVQAGKEKAQIDELIAKRTREAALAQLNLADGMETSAEVAGMTTEELLSLADATRQSSSAAWGAFDAQTRLGESLAAVAEAASKGKRGIDESTEAGRENRDALSGLASDWSASKIAMEENGASAKKVEREYKKVRQALIEAATKMTGSRKEALKLANQLEKPMTLVIKDKTSEAVASAKAAIADLRRAIEGKPIIQNVEVRRKYGPNATVGEPGGIGDLFGGSADGSTVPHGGPYEDRYPYLLAPGEEVISNRFGQADRNRPLLKAINAGLLADGGTAWHDGLPGLASGGTGKRGKARKNADLGAFIDVYGIGDRSLKGFIKSLEESKSALEAESEARVSLAAELGNTVAEMFTSSLGKSSDAWSRGGSWADIFGTLDADTAGAGAYSANVSKLQALGLDDPGALNALLSQNDAASIANLAATGSAALVAQYEQQYQIRAQAVGALNTQVVAAQTAALSAAQAVTNAELTKVNAQLAQLNGIQKAAPAATGKAAAKASNKGASKASQSIRRG